MIYKPWIKYTVSDLPEFTAQKLKAALRKMMHSKNENSMLINMTNGNSSHTMEMWLFHEKSGKFRTNTLKSKF